MAARLRAKHQDEIRQKIQTSQLINVLQNHALGKSEDDISQSRMRAIEILLKKSLSDLSSVEQSGPDGGPQELIVRWGGKAK